MSWTSKKDEEKEEGTSFAERKAKILEQIKEREERNFSFMCCSITGDPKVGKTGTALDCRTDEEIEKGMKIFLLDFDDGAEPTWDSCWDRDENIIIFNPLEVLQDGSIDWLETFSNAHAFCEYVKEVTKLGTVKAVIFDGLDKAVEGASDVLRSHLVKHQKREQTIILDTDSVTVSPLDWKIRNRVHDRLLTSFLSINAHRFMITHMKPIYGNIVNPTPIGSVPDWLKTTPARFIQMLHITKTKVGSTTNYVAELQASKTNSDLVGKEWTIFTTNGDNAWKGIPELKEGTL